MFILRLCYFCLVDAAFFCNFTFGTYLFAFLYINFTSLNLPFFMWLIYAFELTIQLVSVSHVAGCTEIKVLTIYTLPSHTG